MIRLFAKKAIEIAGTDSLPPKGPNFSTLTALVATGIIFLASNKKQDDSSQTVISHSPNI